MQVEAKISRSNFRGSASGTSKPPCMSTSFIFETGTQQKRKAEHINGTKVKHKTVIYFYKFYDNSLLYKHNHLHSHATKNIKYLTS